MKVPIIRRISMGRSRSLRVAVPWLFVSMLSIAGSFGVVIVSEGAAWKAGRSTVFASIVIVAKFAISDT
jgi:hypothetical protein